MKRFLGRLLMIIGAATLILAVVSASAVYYLLSVRRTISQNTVLEIDFSEPIVEYTPEDPATRALMGKIPRTLDLLTALRLAAEDSRVKVLVARIGKTNLGIGKIQEIRDAVVTFRSSGKKAVAHAQSFGEFGPGNGAYYLATAFDEIYLQPSGDLGLTGFIAETPFVKHTLDKLGLQPRLDHREDYKNAMNLFTEDKYTVPHKAALQQVLSSRFEQMVRDISESRKLDIRYLKDLVDQGPFSAAQARDEKLIDGLSYLDEVYAKIKEEVGGEVTFLPFTDYLDRVDPPKTGDTTFALIYGVGAVQTGSSEYNPMSGEMMMGAETVVEAFREAIDDDNVSAVIFRIDSPGGSYIASDAIWRETVRARNSGKPLIVSMGDVAASGGYFVALAADKIVAQPGTITGSIGVIAGKVLTTGFWDKIGVTWDEVHTSQNAAIWSNLQDYTPQQWDRFQGWLDRIYDDFTGKVAEGRKLPKEKVMEIAGGRIWTGEDALRIGLVDELGGFSEAFRLAKEAVGVPQEQWISIKTFPEEKTFLELILEKGFLMGALAKVSGWQDNAMLRALRDGYQRAADAGIVSAPRELQVPRWYYSF
jgi:protease-4